MVISTTIQCGVLCLSEACIIQVSNHVQFRIIYYYDYYTLLGMMIGSHAHMLS